LNTISVNHPMRSENCSELELQVCRKIAVFDWPIEKPQLALAEKRHAMALAFTR
jgi:hypothetical protein